MDRLYIGHPIWWTDDPTLMTDLDGTCQPGTAMSVDSEAVSEVAGACEDRHPELRRYHAVAWDYGWAGPLVFTGRWLHRKHREGVQVTVFDVAQLDAAIELSLALVSAKPDCLELSLDDFGRICALLGIETDAREPEPSWPLRWHPADRLGDRPVPDAAGWTRRADADLPGGRVELHTAPPAAADGEPQIELRLTTWDGRRIASTGDPGTLPLFERVMPRDQWQPIILGDRWQGSQFEGDPLLEQIARKHRAGVWRDRPGSRWQS